MGELGHLPEAPFDPLADLAVELGLDWLRMPRPELGPEGLLPRGHLRIHLRSDEEGAELPGGEILRDEARELPELVEQAAAHPAGPPRWDAEPSAQREPPLGVREAVARLAEEPPEAAVAQGTRAELVPRD